MAEPTNTPKHIYPRSYKLPPDNSIDPRGLFVSIAALALTAWGNSPPSGSIHQAERLRDALIEKGYL